MGTFTGWFIAQWQRGLALALHQRIQRPQKRRERLTGTRRRHHECIVTCGNGLPGFLLNGGGGSENVREPTGYLRAELRQNVFGHALL